MHAIIVDRNINNLRNKIQIICNMIWIIYNKIRIIYNMIWIIYNKMRIIYKNRKIQLSITFANIILIVPIMVLYLIIFAIIVIAFMALGLSCTEMGLLFTEKDLLFTENGLLFTEKVPVNNSTISSSNFGVILKNITNRLLIYLFIMLVVVDLSALILDRYVYKHILVTIENFEKLAPFTDVRKDFIEDKAKSSGISKLYPEKLLIFGVIFILLEIFSKLFSDNGQGLIVILVGISMVLTSIGIWKYLSFKADKSDNNSDFEAMIFSKR